MKKISQALTLFLGLLILLTACVGKPADTVTATPVPAAVPIIAEGHIVPHQGVYLSFLASGRVQEVLVEQGDQVRVGQVLVRLGDREQAAAALAGAQAQEIAARQAFGLLVRTADLGQGQAWQAYMDAQKVRAASQLAWDRLDLNAIQTDIQNAESDVTSRKTDLENAQNDLDKYLTLPADNATRQSYEDALRIAQINYDAAVQKAEDLVNGRDRVHAALNIALAAEAEAKRTYENTQDGPDSDKLALAQSQLDAATAQAAVAQTALDNYDLKAPFAGTVEDVNVSAHQMVGPQTWAVALADTSQWYVDTSDLTEMDVVRVSVGQAVEVTADALPGVTMNGVVESVSGAPLFQGGDVLYTVHIKLTDLDPVLLWGMTVELTFTL